MSGIYPANEGGTVLSVYIVPANGFSGNVASPTTTPTITLSTTVTGIIQGDGTSLSSITIGQGLSFIGGLLSNTGATSVSNSDGTLTISPTTGAVVASIALSHANTWTGQQIFTATSDATKGVIIKAFSATQSANLLEVQNSSGTAFLTVGSPVLTGSSLTSNWLNVTATFPTVRTNLTAGIYYNLTTAGSSAQAIIGHFVNLGAGFTGSNSTIAIDAQNLVAGITTNSPLSGGGNVGIQGISSSNTVGNNIAGFFQGTGGIRSFGVVGAATDTVKANSFNIGSVGYAANTGASGIVIGGIFTLDNTESVIFNESAALIANNGAISVPIFIAKVNNTDVFTIGSTGNWTLADATTISVGSTTGTKIGTATTQKLGFYNTTPVIQQTGDLVTGLSALGLITSGTIAAGGLTGVVAPANGGTGIANNASSTITISGNFATTFTVSATTSITLPASGNIANYASTTETSNSATVVAIGGVHHIHTITALAAANTFGVPTIASGSLDNNYKLMIRIKDNGTARGLSWNAIFRASSDLALPTTTILGKTLYLGFNYNIVDTKWDLVSLLNNF
jgi:hypothetical protein